MDSREERLAKNEILFREFNERIEEAAKGLDVDGHVFEFICECSDTDCVVRLRLTLELYERVRSDPTQFVVAPGHEAPSIETVVTRTDAYEIVRKEGRAGERAAVEDPRG